MRAKLSIALLSAFALSLTTLNAGPPTPTSMLITVDPTEIAPTGVALVTASIIPIAGEINCGQGQIQYDIVGDTDINGLPIGYLQLEGGLAVTANTFGASFDASAIKKDVLGVPTDLASGDQIQLRAGFSPSGGNCSFASQGPGQSPTTTLTIAEACVSPLSITADQAFGPGLVPAGYEGDWTFRIRVTACADVTDVTAQGGTSGWTDYTLTTFFPTVGSAAIRKQNRKTTTLLWTIGDMTAGDSATLLVTVHGKVRPGTSSGTELFLSGPWSSTFTDLLGVTQKSTYTGRVSIEVQ